MPGFLQHAAAFQALSFHAVTSIPAVSVKRASLRKSFPQTQNLTDAVKKPPQPTTESLISKCSVRLQPGNRQHLCCWRVEKPASHSLRFLGVYFVYLSSCLSEEVLHVGARSPVLPTGVQGKIFPLEQPWSRALCRVHLGSVSRFLCSQNFSVLHREGNRCLLSRVTSHKRG